MRAAIFAAMLAASGVPAGAATFVYVSNAEDGDIGMYTLQPDGSLQPGQRFKAEKLVMPMAVSPDKRFLIAAVRSKPYQAYSYSIDPKSGALAPSAPARSPKASPTSRSTARGRFLLGASYGAHLVSVNPVDADGRVGEPLQMIPTARNAHRSAPTTTTASSSCRISAPTRCSSSFSTRRPGGSPRTRRRSCS